MNLSKYITRVPRPKGAVLATNEHALRVLEEQGLEPTIQSLAFTSKGAMRSLLGSSKKTEKGEKKGYITKVMYLYPHMRTGYNVCPFATPSCSKDCLVSQGNLTYPTTKRALIARTYLWHFHPKYFLEKLMMEIFKFHIESQWSGKIPVIRLNGTSDIRWHKYIDMAAIHRDTGIRFYDYTKFPHNDKLPPREVYSLTFSISEDPLSWERADKWLQHGYSAAVVVAADGKNNLKSARAAQQKVVDRGYLDIMGRRLRTIHGDEDDLRMLDRKGGLVVLYAKGKALSEQSPFVHRIQL